MYISLATSVILLSAVSPEQKLFKLACWVDRHLYNIFILSVRPNGEVNDLFNALPQLINRVFTTAIRCCFRFYSRTFSKISVVLGCLTAVPKETFVYFTRSFAFLYLAAFKRNNWLQFDSLIRWSNIWQKIELFKCVQIRFQVCLIIWSRGLIITM